MILKKLSLSEKVSIFTLKKYTAPTPGLAVFGLIIIVTVGQSHLLEGFSTGYLSAHFLVIANLIIAH